MKKIKIAIIILIIVLLILSGTILILYLYSDNPNTSSQNLSKKNEIENYIVFKSSDYESIGDVVFYSKELNLDNNLKENLNIIAEQLKVKYPNKSILYLSDLGSASLFNAKELYRCMQIVNGQKLDTTDMNVLLNEDGSVDFEFLIGCSWKNGSDTQNIKITQKQAEQIVIDYLCNHTEDYNELRHDFSSNSSELCVAELYKYNSKTSWKMQFSTGACYIIIDANTGEILNKYFFCGVYYVD